MKTTLGLVLSLATLALAAGSASADVYSSPHKYTAAASATNLDLGGAGKKLSVDLTGSRKKKMLVVHVSAGHDAGLTGQQVTASVKVNGVTMEPGQLGNHCDKNFCMVSGTVFLDIDAAEAAHPGVFYNTLPMNVELTGASSVPGVSGKLALVTELLKK